MARGGYRPGAGRPRKGEKPIAAEIKAESRKLNLSPLEYMLSVMNDEGADDQRRDRMAVSAAPYVHPKKAEAGDGKKAERQAKAEAAAAGGGKFAVPPAPKLVVDNRS